MWVFVRSFGCLPIRVSTCFLAWLVGCLRLCVLVCFQEIAAHFSYLIIIFETFLVFFLHLGGPWDSIVTLAAPLCHPSWTILHVLCSWWRLGAQFVDSWAPFGHPWGPFWCIFIARRPDIGPLFLLVWKRLEKGAKKERKKEPNWMYFS